MRAFGTSHNAKMVLENRYYWPQQPISIGLLSRTELGWLLWEAGPPFFFLRTSRRALLHLHEFDCAILTIGLSPSGHGSPSCPASRCIIKASIRLYPSQLNSASSRKVRSLYLRTRLASANTAMASALSLLSSSHMVSPLSGVVTVRNRTQRRNRTLVPFSRFVFHSSIRRWRYNHVESPQFSLSSATRKDNMRHCVYPMHPVGTMPYDVIERLQISR
jgi:hypothetical protein